MKKLSILFLLNRSFLQDVPEEKKTVYNTNALHCNVSMPYAYQELILWPILNLAPQPRMACVWLIGPYNTPYNPCGLFWGGHITVFNKAVLDIHEIIPEVVVISKLPKTS